MEIVSENIFRYLGKVELPPLTQEEHERNKHEILDQAKAEGLI